ncbi:MAG: beta-ketoacyl-ACP synthase II [Alphaproteobacteria bacterium]|nr:beta-ketoacyl-ACP synthase II [Alphaproteobacteria bacterium]
MTRRVVVTGLGVVSAIGTGQQSYWNALSRGACGIGRSSATWAREQRGGPFDPVVAEVPDFESAAAPLGRETTRMDRFCQMATMAADEAMADAGLAAGSEDLSRCAVIIGSGIGGHETQDEAYWGMLKRDRRVHPLTVLRTISSSAPSHLSIRYGLRGPAFAVSSACASGAHAIGVCADMIRSGSLTMALTGAAEACLTYGCLTAWNAMHIMSDSLCRPFSRNRNGLVIGEGAGILVLEEYEHAVARGAVIHAEVVGFGMNADARDMINPSVDGAREAMMLATAGIALPAPERVHINAHGTGTLANDPTETQAIRQAFGPGAEAMAVCSTKSMHGHLLGAAGAVESIAAILAMKHSLVPPTINLDEPDPQCDLDYTPNVGQAREIDLAVSNSFAFGGLNAVLAFGKPR